MERAAAKSGGSDGADHQEQTCVACIVGQHALSRARREARNDMRREPGDAKRQPEAEALKALL